MKQEHLTVVKMLQSLIGYFIDHEITDIKTHLDIKKEGALIEIEGATSEKPYDFDELAKALKVDRQSEMDDYQESLLEIHREEDDYHLIGMGVDTAEVDYHDGVATVKVYRKNLYNE